MSTDSIQTRHALARAPAWLLSAALLLAAWGAAPAVAPAQQPLSEQIERLRRDINDLQKFVYRDAVAGNTATGAANTATGGDFSSGISDDMAARLQVKLQNLQDQMRNMTGRLEELEFNLRRSAERLDRLSGDLDFRLQRLEGGTATGGTTTAPTGGTANTLATQPGTGVDINAGTAADAGNAQTAATLAAGGTAGTITGDGGVITRSGVDANVRIETRQGETLQPGQQLFGILRTNSSGEVIAAAPGQTTANGATSGPSPNPFTQNGNAAPATDPADGINTAPVDGNVAAVDTGAASSILATGTTATATDLTPEERYAQAYTLLQKRDFPAAEQALRNFLNLHGDHERAGNAIYWLGESYYARKNYRDAAATFVDAYTRYPKSGKASHSLLKLGMALSSLGKTDAACTALKTLREQYADAETRILKTAQAEMARAGCS